MRLPRSVVPVLFVAALFGVQASAQEVTQENVDGVMNFKRLETTIACAGATHATAVPEIKKMGYASIINLRLPSENGADIDAEAAAANAAGIRFVHIPFDHSNPTASAADQFVAAVTAPENQPAFVHCATGNRAAMMWMIKRMTVDHWEADRAGKEAAELGLTSPALKKFALDYSQSHTK